MTIVVVASAPAFAHMGLASSTPGNEEVVDGPITEIKLTFTSPVELDGNGLVVLTGDGQTRKPNDARTEDNETWNFVFNQPLAPGPAGARWAANAGDGHSISGSFEFTINPAPVPSEQTPSTSTELTPDRSVPSTDDAETSADDTQTSTDDAETSADDTQTSADDQPTEPPAGDRLAETSAGQDAVAEADLSRFLADTDDGAPFVTIASGLANLLTILGTVGAIGCAVVSAFVLGADHRSFEVVSGWLTKAGMVVIVGAVLQFATQAAVLARSWSGSVSPSVWVEVFDYEVSTAIMIRCAAGLAIMVGRQVAGINERRWGVAILPLSFGFDGHSVTEGNRFVHLVASTIHTAAGAVWVGGLVVLAVLLVRHRRAGSSADTWSLAARFSTVATVALVTVSVAGVAISAMILDDPSQLWSSDWGRLLIGKVVVIGLAAMAGAYNHFRLVPQLEASAGGGFPVHSSSPADSGFPVHSSSPTDSDLAVDQALVNRFRVLASAEAVILIAAVVLTAFLVQASPV